MKKTPPGEIGEMLALAAQRLGSKRAVAEKLRISESYVGRAIRNGKLGALNCLRLAKLLGESADSVLLAAGKGEVVDLLSELYGQSTPMVSRSDRKVLSLWHALPRTDRETIHSLMRRLTPSTLSNGLAQWPNAAGRPDAG